MRPKAPPQELAAVYLPIVRGYLLAIGLYYTAITVSHLYGRSGQEAFLMAAVAGTSAAVCVALWRRLAKPATLLFLEMAAVAGACCLLGNILIDQALSFTSHQLVYHLLIALAVAVAGPTPRIAFSSVAVSLVSMVLLARFAPPSDTADYPFMALAAGFVAVGMSALMRGAVLRELRARLAAEELNRKLGDELALNEALRRTAQALAQSEQAANRTKSEFLATITHELRTPLNGVLGMAQVMAMGDLDQDQRERLEVILSSGRALLSTINDVLDISKIEAGRLELSPTTFDLDDLAADLAGLYGGLAAEKGLAFELDVAPGAGGWRVGDDVRLRQVFANLLANALKFTDRGSVQATLSADGEVAVFQVTDTGVGVPADMADRLFQKFVQADASTTRRFGGTGLGLAICREIVEQMGGEIGFTSRPGEGSCFTVRVPLPKTAKAVSAADLPTAKPFQRAVRVLVADDNPVNRMVVETLLAPMGVTTRDADSGLAALEAWEAEPWDLVLMDIHMPGMDGLAAAAEIRARERANGRPRTPIVALTASVLSHETDRYLAAGMDDFVAKPLELTRLTAVLEELLAASQPAAVRSA